MERAIIPNSSSILVLIVRVYSIVKDRRRGKRHSVEATSPSWHFRSIATEIALGVTSAPEHWSDAIRLGAQRFR
jgi:hypothetical protein